MFELWGCKGTEASEQINIVYQLSAKPQSRALVKVIWVPVVVVAYSVRDSILCVSQSLG